MGWEALRKFAMRFTINQRKQYISVHVLSCQRGFLNVFRSLIVSCLWYSTVSEDGGAETPRTAHEVWGRGWRYNSPSCAERNQHTKLSTFDLTILYTHIHTSSSTWSRSSICCWKISAVYGARTCFLFFLWSLTSYWAEILFMNWWISLFRSESYHEIKFHTRDFKMSAVILHDSR